MRYSTLEIRWHETKPIFSADFQASQAVQHKRQLNPFQRTATNVSDGDGKLWRVATAGGDSQVRIWLAIPNPPIASTSAASSSSNQANGLGASSKAGPSTTSAQVSQFAKPKVEYLATLSGHDATVNVVRFSPSGNILATAGDDSGIRLWKRSTAAFGSLNQDSYEKETWKPFKIIQTPSQQQTYDLCWSPDGQFLLAACTDTRARIYRVINGMCVAELADHKDWVQGVAWDPLGRFVATQSKDRTMCIYAVEPRPTSDPRDAGLACKLVSRNVKLYTEIPTSTSSAASTSAAPGNPSADGEAGSGAAGKGNAEATQSPAPSTTTSSQLMYGDEESTPFFRRLAFAPDGSVLVTPAGIYEDPYASSSTSTSKAMKASASTASSPVTGKEAPASGREKRKANKGPGPTSYLFARGQLANETAFAHLPGHKTSSVVVRFNPVLWELRGANEKGKGKGKEEEADRESGFSQDDGEMHAEGEAQSRQEKVEEERTLAPHHSALKTKTRSIYAVATHDTVLIYDTQQVIPIAFFGSLHFAAFTDLAWTSDGLTLIATSSDGYASLFAFEEGELGAPAANQPARPLSPLEESDIFTGSTTIMSSPVKALQENGANHVTTIASSPAQAMVAPVESRVGEGQARTGLVREDSDLVLLDGPAQPNNGENPEKKVKKRVALQHHGPVGT